MSIPSFSPHSTHSPGLAAVTAVAGEPVTGLKNGRNGAVAIEASCELVVESMAAAWVYRSPWRHAERTQPMYCRLSRLDSRMLMLAGGGIASWMLLYAVIRAAIDGLA